MMKRCALILLGTLVGLGSAANGQASAAPNQFFVQQFWMWPYDPALPYASPWYSPCYPFASCTCRNFSIAKAVVFDSTEDHESLRSGRQALSTAHLAPWPALSRSMLPPTHRMHYVQAGA